MKIGRCCRAFCVFVGICGVSPLVLAETALSANGQRDYAHQLGAGGLVMEGVFGRSVTANITPHRKTGIGDWTDGDISRALTTGERPDGRRLASPMPVPYLARRHPDDRAALIAWLRTLPPIVNRIER